MFEKQHIIDPDVDQGRRRKDDMQNNRDVTVSSFLIAGWCHISNDAIHTNGFLNNVHYVTKAN